jgi:ATP-binding cassette, subfamily B, bacterial
VVSAAARPSPRSATAWWRRSWRGVPVILQASAYECGAASLAMILGHFGRKTKVQDCTECYGAGRDGVSAAAVARDARRLGLVVKTYSVTIDKLRTLPLPLIAYWNFSHFVVVERVARSGVHIVDPAVGRRRVPWAEFDQSFTGVAMTFVPGIKFERKAHRQRGQGMKMVLGMLGNRPLPLLAQILGISALLQVSGMVFPLFTKVLVDHFVPIGAVDAMGLLLGGLVTVLVARMSMSLLRARAGLVLQNRLDWSLMHGITEHLLNLPLRFFQRRSAADVLNRLGGASAIRQLVTNQALGVVLDAVFVTFYLAILVKVAPRFAAVAVVFGLLESIFVVLTRKQVQFFMHESLQAQTDCQTVMSEAVTGIETVKMAGAERAVLERWSDLFAKGLALNLRRANVGMIMDTGMGIIQNVAPLLVVWMGARQVLEGTMTVGTMFALSALVTGVIGPLSSLASTVRALQVAAVHLRRLWTIMDEKAENQTGQLRPAPRLSGTIELRKVSFRYAENAPCVLKSIDVKIEAGQKVALVGKTGSGKSTLAALFLGLHAPSDGELFYDGVALSTLDRSSVRAQFGAVPQEPFLFTGTIRDNIALSDKTVPLDQIETVASQACVAREIEAMPMGYHTVLAGGGRSLSGGQKQRIALARALLRNPAILLLDEATSHLDVVTEAQVDAELDQLSCTRLVIAHRMSTVRSADLILVLEDGAIVERGTHGELLARGGRYAALVTAQAGPGVTVPDRRL